MIPDEEAFLRAILESPGDDSLRLIYADWLEERGDPRSADIRARPEIFRLIAGLKDSTQAPFEEIDRNAERHGVPFLSCLAETLERCRHLLPNLKWPGIIDSTMNRLEHQLALTPGSASVASILSRPVTLARCRTFASMLASGQPSDVLLALFERPYEESDLRFELLACLLHEMIVRGAKVSGLPSVERFMDKMRANEHPLACLPLVLTQAEADFRPYVPFYHVDGGRSWSVAQGPSRTIVQPLANSQEVVPLSELTDKADADLIGAAVRDWQEHSNGQVEVRVFRSISPVEEHNLSVAFLASMDLISLAGAATKEIRAERVSSERALTNLFSAASTGGAYSNGVGAAYGRLAAWQSMAGLTGVSTLDGIESIEEVANRCYWISFDAASEWFNQIAWDRGLVAIRPDRMTIAVLAATDTD